MLGAATAQISAACAEYREGEVVERLQHLGHGGVAWQQGRVVGVTGPPASPVVLCSTSDVPMVKVRTFLFVISQCERPSPPRP